MKEDRVSDDKQPDPLAVLAATLEGDRWLSAEAAAFLLGQLKMSTFYQIAAAPDFPKAAARRALPVMTGVPAASGRRG